MSTTEAGRQIPDNPDPRDGVSLGVVIDSRRLDELSCARILGTIADAVHAAHRSGPPVAALTPSAILLRPDGSVAFTAAPASPRYAAPERLRGGAADRRTDVFTLGVILWEALAHERLFDGPDDAAVTRAVLDGAFRPPSELNANVPAELDAICKRALARDPADRYPSAKVMAAEIEAMLGDAGYPESNEPIALFLAALAAPAPPPRSVTPAAGLPASAPPSPDSRTQVPAVTQRMPTIAPGGTQVVAVPPAVAAAPAAKPRAATQPPTGTPARGTKTAPLPAIAPAAPDPAPTTVAPGTPVTAAAPASSASEVPAPGATGQGGSAEEMATPAAGAPAPAMSPSEMPAPGATGQDVWAQEMATPAPALSPSTMSAPSSSASVKPTPAPALSPSTMPAPSSSASAAPTPATVAADAARLNAPAKGTARDTLPPPFVPRQGAQTALPASAGGAPVSAVAISPSASSAPDASPTPPAPPTTEPPGAVATARRSTLPAETQILGSLSLRLPAAPDRSPPAVTAFPGSNASEPSMTPAGVASPPAPLPASPSMVPTAMPMPGPAPADGVSYAPPEMPAPRASGSAAPDAGQAPSPSGPSLHPRPHSPRVLAHTDTSQTPHLAGPVGPGGPLGMPPGITVPPASPPAPLQSADAGVSGALAGEPDPAEAVSLPRARRASTGGPDVLAGWAWSTGSMQAIPDDDDFADVARAGRRRLLIAIGGALAVVVVLVVVALAVGGSQPAAGPSAQASAAAPGSRPATPVPQAPPARPASPPSEAAAAASPAPNPEAPGEPPPAAPTTAPAPAAAGEPPPAPPAAPPAAESPAAAPSPPAAAAPSEPPPAAAPSPPAATPPPSSTAVPSPPAAAPSPPAAAPSPPAAAPSTNPPHAAPSTPPHAAAPSPPAVPPSRSAAESRPTPPKPAPPAAAPAAALPDAVVARKPEAKKPEPRPPEPKPPRIRRTTTAERAGPSTKAQPIDPYAPSAAAEPRPDPAIAYRTGLQQYARGDNAGALATLRASASANPGFAPTWRGLGLVYEKLGNKGPAKSAFRRYLQLAPDAADADQIRDRMERLGP